MCDDIEYQTLISFEPVYNNEDHTRNNTLLFVFDVKYTLAQEPDSDGEEQDYETLPNLALSRTLEVDKDWLMGGNKAQIKANVSQILETIDVPLYRDIVKTLASKITVLKDMDANDDLPRLERINVSLDVTVYSFPENVYEYVVHDLRLAAPAA